MEEIKKKKKKIYKECGISFSKKSNGYYSAVIFQEYKSDLSKPKKRYDLSATGINEMRKKIRDFVTLSNSCDINLLFWGTLQEYSIIWLQKKKDKAERKGKFGGYSRLEYSLEHYILPAMGNKKLMDITREDLQLFINDYGNKYSKSSTNKVLGPLKELFTYAYKNKHIPQNTASLLHGLNDENYGVDTKTTFSLTVDEQKIVEDICKYENNGKLKYRLGYAYILILNTGLRRGEIIALEWDDIDFEHKKLHVNKSIVLRKSISESGKTTYDEIIEIPKTKNSIRVIPLNSNAVTALQHLKELNENSKWVISNKSGQRLKLNNFSDTLRYILKINGFRVFGPHILRHTFATRLYQKGVRIDKISKLMGHSSVEITYNYIHADKDCLHNYMNKAILYNTDLCIV